MSNPPAPTSVDCSSTADAAARAAALSAFQNAAARSPGYHDWLVDRGVDPAAVTDLDQVPYLVKQDVFGGDVSEWLVGGRLSGAAELLTSSGRGGMFSIGVSSRAEQQALEATADAALRGFGASEDSTTLLMNCLPMGINVPTTLATVATPSVHLEMAQEIYERLAPGFDRVVILGEPVFLKEFAERLYAAHGEPWTATATSMIVGGEWVSESWRAYVAGLLGAKDAPSGTSPQIVISMGAAELGLNLLFELPELRLLRAVLDSSDHGVSIVRNSLGYTPSLFAYDPSRIFIEEREHSDGFTTLAFTAFGRRLLPLVRYDLGDMAELVPADVINDAFAKRGLPDSVSYPVVAFWGRRSDNIQIRGRVLRPERIKQRLFALAAEAAVLTGRFYLDPQPEPTLHLQLRPGTVPTPRLDDDYRSFMRELAGTPVDVQIYQHDEYPFHPAGDFQHKPIYHAAR